MKIELKRISLLAFFLGMIAVHSTWAESYSQSIPNGGLQGGRVQTGFGIGPQGISIGNPSGGADINFQLNSQGNKFNGISWQGSLLKTFTSGGDPLVRRPLKVLPRIIVAPSQSLTDSKRFFEGVGNTGNNAFSPKRSGRRPLAR